MILSEHKSKCPIYDVQLSPSHDNGLELCSGGDGKETIDV